MRSFNTAPTTFKNIVVATDFQECSSRAVALASDLAKNNAAELVVMHAYEPPSYGFTAADSSHVAWLTPLRQSAQESLNYCVASLEQRGVRARGVLRMGATGEQILRVAKECHADLIVLGTHGRLGVSHALLGSVAEVIVRTSEVPVLTVRGIAAA